MCANVLNVKYTEFERVTDYNKTNHIFLNNEVLLKNL